jgi:hypothetical protein
LGDPLKENLLLLYKPLHLEAQQVSTRTEACVDINRFPEFKSKGIEFEVGDKYLFRQLIGLLIRQSCQACSSKPLARYYDENKSQDQFEDLKI